jgi:hypothetical protein
MTKAHDPLKAEEFKVNFSIGLAERVAARMGAPAWAQRRDRMHRSIQAFWARAARRYDELWVAAIEGRIDDEGREIRMALLDGEGKDELAEREHRYLLLKQKMEHQPVTAALFERAWTYFARFQAGLRELQLEAEQYAEAFPVEAELPLDPERHVYLWMGEPWVPPAAPTEADLLARFPLRR